MTTKAFSNEPFFTTKILKKKVHAAEENVESNSVGIDCSFTGLFDRSNVNYPRQGFKSDLETIIG